MPAGFLDLPAELRIHIYELLFKPKEPVEVRKYLTNRVIRSVTRAKKKAGTDPCWKNVKPTGTPAFMATCQQVHSESCAMLYASTTFHCERISDFSEFSRTIGSANSARIATVKIASHNYHLLTKLTVLTGLETLVVSVGYPAVWPPPVASGPHPLGWNGTPVRRNGRWIRRPETIEALKRFAEAHTSLKRVAFVERDWPGCYAYDAATNIEEVASEVNEHIRSLRSS